MTIASALERYADHQTLFRGFLSLSCGLFGLCLFFVQQVLDSLDELQCFLTDLFRRFRPQDEHFHVFRFCCEFFRAPQKSFIGSLQHDIQEMMDIFHQFILFQVLRRRTVVIAQFFRDISHGKLNADGSAPSPEELFCSLIRNTDGFRAALFSEYGFHELVQHDIRPMDIVPNRLYSHLLLSVQIKGVQLPGIMQAFHAFSRMGRRWDHQLAGPGSVLLQFLYFHLVNVIMVFTLRDFGFRQFRHGHICSGISICVFPEQRDPLSFGTNLPDPDPSFLHMFRKPDRRVQGFSHGLFLFIVRFPGRLKIDQAETLRPGKASAQGDAVRLGVCPNRFLFILLQILP